MKYFFTAVLFISVLSSHAQHDFDSLYDNNDEFRTYIDDYSRNYDLFSGEEMIEMNLISDFKNLIKRKYHDEYQEAILEFDFNDTVIVRRQVKIKPRGEYRRKNCHNPPLMLNFKKKDVLIPHLRDFDKIKFVDVCRNNDLYEQYLVIEYLVYKMYNRLSDLSFRARFLSVTYIDTSGKYKLRKHYAFMIEDIEQLAKRHDAVLYEKERISPKSTDQQITGIMDVFQYMIGNTDYYIPMEHNIKMIKLKDVTKPRPVVIPYDFDYSGIVNASYAAPNEMYPIEHVTERYYKGNCQTKERYQEIIEIFIEKKTDFYDVIQNSGELTIRSKKQAIKYLDQFYKKTDKPDNFTRFLLNSCQQ